MMTSLTSRIALTAASVAARVLAALAPMTMRLPPPTALLVRVGGRFADELSVHHRHAPVPAGAEPLGDLPAVAEETDRRAELELVFARVEFPRSTPSLDW